MAAAARGKAAREMMLLLGGCSRRTLLQAGCEGSFAYSGVGAQTASTTTPAARALARRLLNAASAAPSRLPRQLWRPFDAAGPSSSSSAARTAARRAYSSAVAAPPPAPWYEPLSLWWASGASAPGASVAGRAYSYASTSVLAALNLVGAHLPRLLGLAAAEMARCSPLLGGARADAWTLVLEPPPLLSGAAAAALAAKHGDPSTAEGSKHSITAAARRASAAALLAAQRLTAAASAAARAAASAAAGYARMAWLALLFAPVLLSAPLALQWGVRRAEWMELLRATLEAAGPAFIKWGQWAATRHDLFPPDLCGALEALHSAAPAHAWRHTDAAVERAFGLPVKELFDWIESTPIASGSIGQVHRATLSAKGAAVTGCAPGALVAVKVRHPGVCGAIERDFAAMMAAASLASALAPRAVGDLRLEETLRQFEAPLHEQVDLCREARNLFRFGHNFRRTRHVSFPTPLYPLVAADVLVETYEPGRGISDYIAAGERQPYSHRLAELGSGTMLQMMLVDNLIHSDLHPGNILVRLEAPTGLLGVAHTALRALSGGHSSHLFSPELRGKLSALREALLQPRIVLLDVGMTTELSGVDQTNMIGLFRSFAALDGKGAAEWILRFAGDAQACPAPTAFVTDLGATFSRLRESQLARGGWDTTHFNSGADALAAVLESIRTHRVTLPGHIAAVVVTTLVLEGWSNRLDPHHSVLAQVQGMFEPQNLGWRERLGAAVDVVMERSDGGLAIDA